MPAGERLPRLADFYRLAVAAEVGAGRTGDAFRSAYARNQSDTHGQALDDPPLPAALHPFMARPQPAT